MFKPTNRGVFLNTYIQIFCQEILPNVPSQIFQILDGRLVANVVGAIAHVRRDLVHPLLINQFFLRSQSTSQLLVNCPVLERVIRPRST